MHLKIIYLQQSQIYHILQCWLNFAPDYILFKKSEPQEIYFLELKVSKTPLYSATGLAEIQQNKSTNIKISDVGNIAREAWNAYKNLYPNTIILDAFSYDPKIIMAQFVNKIKCLRCYKTSSEGFDCANCPVESKGFFEIERNFNSQGSQTPHTNIDYSSFESVESFFEKINIRIDHSILKELKESVKNEGVSFPTSTFESVKAHTKLKLKQEGCYWLKKISNSHLLF